jgi:DNA-binding transcriptional MerR regulator
MLSMGTDGWKGKGMLRISELASRTGTTADTLRYYERLGLLWPSSRTDSGYRLYAEAELRRLQFIRRAKLLGLSLEEIRDVLRLAEGGQCYPLRHQVTELLRHKIEDCEGRLAELAGLKASLEERYRLALQSEGEPACGCAGFPADCACLPLPLEALDVSIAKEAMMAKSAKGTRKSQELKVVNALLCQCGCACTANQLCDCGCGCADQASPPRSMGAPMTRRHVS